MVLMISLKDSGTDSKEFISLFKDDIVFGYFRLGDSAILIHYIPASVC